MEGEENYPAIDKLLAEPEFSDMADRVVITAEPEYLAKFTTTPQVIIIPEKVYECSQRSEIILHI